MRRLYSSSLSVVEAMKRPPLLIQPGSTPVSPSSRPIRALLRCSSSTSMSLGRRLHTRPAHSTA